MTSAECRYAPIEKEALATTWALEYWPDLVIMRFTVETDHKLRNLLLLLPTTMFFLFNLIKIFV